MSLADVLRLLEGFSPDVVPRAEESLRRTLTLVRTEPKPFDRSAYRPGHLTASAIVLSPRRDQVLLIWHERLGRWLQPGGHFEVADPDAPGAARREVREETGVVLAPGPAILVGVDVHEIPAARGEPAHLHHDLVFGFGLHRMPAALAGEARAEWCAVDDLPARGADDPLRRAVARARLALGYSM